MDVLVGRSDRDGWKWKKKGRGGRIVAVHWVQTTLKGLKNGYMTCISQTHIKKILQPGYQRERIRERERCREARE